MNKRKKLGKNIFINFLISIVLILCFFFLLFPVYWILTMALKTNPDILTYPPKFFFQPVIKGFQYILGLVEVVGATGVSAGVESWFLVGIKNSIIVVVSTILISLAVGLPAAYVLARYKLKGKEDIAFTISAYFCRTISRN